MWPSVGCAATWSPVRQVMHEVVDRIDYLHRHQGQILGVPSGFTQLDRLLGGFQKSDLIILAARPAVGKTSLALNFALNAARRFRKVVAYFSLEMSAEQLVQRLLSTETGHRPASARARARSRTTTGTC